MKAIMYTRYGSPEVLELKEIPKPVPKDDEILIKIFACTVTKGDCEMRSPKIPSAIWLIVRLFFGILKPKKQILGQELAGEIEAVGINVTQYKAGDQIIASTGSHFGAYAEYVCLPAKYPIALKPANLTFEEAAAIPVGGLNALHYLRKAKIQHGQKVLVNGASGNFGTYAVQLAKYFGAEVTGVDRADKLDILISIGAAQVIDYTQEDFTKNADSYDVVFDLICRKSFSSIFRSLKQNGVYLLANPNGLFQMICGYMILLLSRKKIILEFADEKSEDLYYLKELVESGKIKPIIDRSYTLDQIPEAHNYVESGKKKGIVVININN